MFQIQSDQDQPQNGYSEKPASSAKESSTSDELDALQIEKTRAEIKVLKEYLKDKQSEMDATNQKGSS